MGTNKKQNKKGIKIMKLEFDMTQEDKGKEQVVAYMRYSSTNQDEESIKYQRAAIMTYAHLKGYYITCEYIDEAKSGRTDKRDGFQEMIADARKLYESYDLYGENHSDFQEFEKEPEVRNSNSKVNKDYFNNALKAFQGIDMDKISNNIQSISKMIGAFSEFTNKQENKSDSSYKRRPYRRYDD